ncbi:alpha/beta hydrolase [Erwinia sp. CPCC 100877]|nr:alpha/beta hydrolase [Erwinia sp. CPCC 100877]
MNTITKKVDDYYLDIFYPKNIENGQKLPVLYVLDGDAFTVMIAEAVKLQIRNSPKTKVQPLLIVGISYHAETPFHRERRFVDYTPPKVNPADPNDIRSQMPAGGGIDTFFQKLEKMHQVIAADFSIDSQKVGLFGHSLGGLCVMEALLRKELNFLTDYLAVSPSLWWDQEAYFPKLEAARSSFQKNRRVMLSVGSTEGDMVPLATRAFTYLKKYQLTKACNFYLAEEENHMSVVFTVISRYLRWFSEIEGINK